MAKKSKAKPRTKRAKKTKEVWVEMTPEEIVEYEKTLPPRHGPNPYAVHGEWGELNEYLDRVEAALMKAIKHTPRDERFLTASDGLENLRITRDAIDGGNVPVAIRYAIQVGIRVALVNEADRLFHSGKVKGSLPAARAAMLEKNAEHRGWCVDKFNCKMAAGYLRKNAIKEVAAEFPDQFLGDTIAHGTVKKYVAKPRVKRAK